MYEWRWPPQVKPAWMCEWRWPPRVLSLSSLLWLCECSGFWVYPFHFCWFCLFKSAMVHCCCCRGLPCLSHPKSFLFPSWDPCSDLAGIKHHTVIGWRVRNRKLKDYNTTEEKKVQKLGGGGGWTWQGRLTGAEAALATCHGCLNNQGSELLSLSLLCSQAAPSGLWIQFLDIENTEILFLCCPALESWLWCWVLAHPLQTQACWFKSFLPVLWPVPADLMTEKRGKQNGLWEQTAGSVWLSKTSAKI